MSEWGTWVNLRISRIHLTRQWKNVGENYDDLTSRRLIRTMSTQEFACIFLKQNLDGKRSLEALGVPLVKFSKELIKGNTCFQMGEWAKYTSVMSLSFDSFTLILFCHLLGKSKWEAVGQFIITTLSIQSLNIKQWIQERAGVYQAASGSDLPMNITYSWVCYIIELFFPLWQVKLLFLLFVGEHFVIKFRSCQ